MAEVSRRRLFQLTGLGVVASFGIQLQNGLLGLASAIGLRDRFRLANPSKALLVSNGVAYSVKPGVNTVPQCFGFDEAASALYVVQETEESQSSNSATRGDLVVSRFPASGKGTPKTMTLKHAGHGAGLAVEHIYGDEDAYLWVECGGGTDGTGTGLARFQYEDGATIDLSSGNIAPVYSGWQLPRAYFEHRQQHLALKYMNSDKTLVRIVVYKMADVRIPNSAVIRDLNTVPPWRDRVIVRSGTGTSSPIQGFCVYGDFVYLLQGGSKNSTDPTVYLRSYDLTKPSGGIVEETVINIWAGITKREPEGLCVRKEPDQDGVVKDKLVFGLVDGDYDLWLGFKDGYV